MVKFDIQRDWLYSWGTGDFVFSVRTADGFTNSFAQVKEEDLEQLLTELVRAGIATRAQARFAGQALFSAQSGDGEGEVISQKIASEEVLERLGR